MFIEDIKTEKDARRVLGWIIQTLESPQAGEREKCKAIDLFIEIIELVGAE